jgi:hypothetical protein
MFVLGCNVRYANFIGSVGGEEIVGFFNQVGLSSSAHESEGTSGRLGPA